MAWAITAERGMAIGYAIAFTNNSVQPEHRFSVVADQFKEMLTVAGCVAAAGQYHMPLADKAQ